MDEVIRMLAYKIYQERKRNGQEGTAEGDWLKAEEEFWQGRSYRQSFGYEYGKEPRRF